MTRKTSLKGDIVKKYLKRFPKTPTLTLAKKIYNENKKIFLTIENVRSILRHHTGKMGNKQRSNIGDKSMLQPVEYKYNPFELPESHSVKAITWRLPRGYKKVLVLSDIHFPYHDSEAIQGALQYGKDKDVDCIYINGDMLDFYQLSFHEKDPRKTSIPDELEMARNFFKMLRRTFLRATIYYIPGNHEYRLERYLRVKAPELLDMQEFRLDILLKCGEYGVNYIPHGSKCYMGKLLVEHGDKMRGAGGVNPARTLSLRFKRPTLCGHFHRTSSSNSVVYDDDNIMCWSTGCLCELEPGYMPLNEHNHGAAIVEVDHDKGYFKVDNFQIIKGRVY